MDKEAGDLKYFMFTPENIGNHIEDIIDRWLKREANKLTDKNEIARRLGIQTTDEVPDAMGYVENIQECDIRDKFPGHQGPKTLVVTLYYKKREQGGYEWLVGGAKVEDREQIGS